MLLWTIQPEEVWRILRQDGVYRCRPDKATHLNDGWDYDAPYNWMVAQMENRIGKRPEGVTYPIWAWHTYNWKHKKPDLRTDWFRGRHGVHTCIEIDVPDNAVLLSDEENWHFVLNDWYFSGAKSEEEYKRDDAEYEALPEDEKRRARKKSWERIFEVEPIDIEWHRQGCYVQAVFWEITLGQVRKVTWFGRTKVKARKA